MAVKRMPTSWVRSGPAEFDECYPTATERPWVDVAILRSLDAKGFSYACKLHGIFRSGEDTLRRDRSTLHSHDGHQMHSTPRW